MSCSCSCSCSVVVFHIDGIMFFKSNVPILYKNWSFHWSNGGHWQISYFLGRSWYCIAYACFTITTKIFVLPKKVKLRNWSVSFKNWKIRQKLEVRCEQATKQLTVNHLKCIICNLSFTCCCNIQRKQWEVKTYA